MTDAVQSPPISSAPPSPATVGDPAAGRGAERRRARWLQRRARAGRPWLSPALVLGYASGVLGLLQCWAVAGLIAALIVDPAGLGGVSAGLVLTALGAVLARVALGGVAEVLGIRAGQAVTRQMRADVLAAVARLGPAWTAERRSGEVVSTLLEQIDAVEGFVARYLPARTLASAVPLTLLAAVLAMDWRAGLILLAFGAIVPVAMALVGWRTAARARGQMTEMRRMSGYFLDRLQNLATLKLFGAEWRERDRMRQVSDRFRARTMDVLKLAFLSSTTLELLSMLAIATVAVSVLTGTLATVADRDWRLAIFVILLVPELFQPLRRLGQHYHDKAAAVGAAEAIIDVLDAASALPVEADAPPAGPALGRAPALRLERVGLTYEGGARVALDAVSFDIASGEMVALVGESGSGKSSILDILAGFRRPDSGSVRIDGAPLQPALVRPILARAGQSPRVVAGTLADNLRLGRPDAPDAALWDALEVVGLEPLARRLPDRLDTLVGEGGRGLSGGEARRLGLARAILRAAPLVLLDEPTANLDAESEAGVLAGIDALRAGRTIVIATHAPAVMGRADRVIPLCGGRVARLAEPAGEGAADG